MIYNAVTMFNACCRCKGSVLSYGNSFSFSILPLAGIKTVIALIPGYGLPYFDWLPGGSGLPTGLFAGVNPAPRSQADMDTMAATVLGSVDLSGINYYCLFDEPVVFLSWTPGIGQTFTIKRATVSGGPYTTIGTTASNSFLDTFTASTAPANCYYVVSAGGVNSNEVAAALPVFTNGYVFGPGPQYNAAQISPGQILHSNPLIGLGGSVQAGVPALQMVYAGGNPLKQAYLDIRSPQNLTPVYALPVAGGGVAFSRGACGAFPLVNIPASQFLISGSRQTWRPSYYFSNGVAFVGPLPNPSSRIYAKTRGFLPDIYNALINGVFFHSNAFQMKFKLSWQDTPARADVDLTGSFPAMPAPPALTMANYQAILDGINLGYSWSMANEVQYGPDSSLGDGLVFYY